MAAMTRETQEDFQELKEFVRQYKIEPSEVFISQLRIGHKRLFGLLTFIAEIESNNDETNKFSDDSLGYFAEFRSDVSQALFCWIHGAYKPAFLSLRTSIETFIKAAVCTEDPSVLTEKSMYELLELAKGSAACGGLGEAHFHNIKSSYGVLCGIAHSATAAKFTQVNALRMFPKFEEADATQFIRQFNALVDRFIAVLLAFNRDLLPRMHFKNRQNVLDTLTKEIKQSILGEEAN